VDPEGFTLVTQTGYSVASYRPSWIHAEETLGSIVLQPGTRAKGLLAFRTEDTPMKLVYSELNQVHLESVFE